MKRYAQHPRAPSGLPALSRRGDRGGPPSSPPCLKTDGRSAADDGVTSVSNSRFGRNDNWIKMSGKIIIFFASLNI